MSFGKEYARLYDAKYSGKNYVAECGAIERTISESSLIPVASIMDVGCGSGEHSIELARRGFLVTGIDRSPEMIKLARQKRSGGANPKFVVGDATRLQLGERFDAVILMFAVLSYMETNSDLIACLTSVQRHLKPGGVVIADFWYATGVLTDPPLCRQSDLVIDGERVSTCVQPHMYPEKNICRLDYEIVDVAREERFHEEHRIRFFSVPELMLALEAANLRFIGAFEGETWDRPLTGYPWTATLVARH